jgi:hypothetical protein
MVWVSIKRSDLLFGCTFFAVFDNVGVWVVPISKHDIQECWHGDLKYGFRLKKYKDAQGNTCHIHG